MSVSLAGRALKRVMGNEAGGGEAEPHPERALERSAEEAVLEELLRKIGDVREHVRGNETYDRGYDYGLPDRRAGL